MHPPESRPADGTVRRKLHEDDAANMVIYGLALGKIELHSLTA